MSKLGLQVRVGREADADTDTDTGTDTGAGAVVFSICNKVSGSPTGPPRAPPRARHAGTMVEGEADPSTVACSPHADADADADADVDADADADADARSQPHTTPACRLICLSVISVYQCRRQPPLNRLPVQRAAHVCVCMRV